MIARIAAVALLAAAIVPEVRRYGAERLLWRMHSAADLLAADPENAPDAREVVAWISRSAEEAAAALPGDRRPAMLAGEARIGVRDVAGALAWLRRASADGERADVDFEMGRAFILSRDFAPGQEALVRAAWVSPAVLAPLPEAAQRSFETVIARLEADLRGGRLAAPPPRAE